MTSFTTTLATRTVAVPVEFFAALQQAAQDSDDALATDALRDAGYRAGQALFESFTDWLTGQGEPAPDQLPHDEFGRLASAFFQAAGWGELALTSLGDAVMMVDATGWGEAASGTGECLVSTGLLSGFFGRLADAPIAVLEVECADTSGDRCRFLLGSVDVMAYVHEEMERGIPYETAAANA